MPTFRLVSATGDQTFELKDGRTLVVGRGVTSDIAIYDPTISRRHAELVVAADGVQVKDLGSSNGTCINGTRVTSGRLTPDDTVTFGKVVFRREEAPAAAPAAAPVLSMSAVSTGSHAPGGLIVRQLQVSGGIPAGMTSSEQRMSEVGQLRVAAAGQEPVRRPR